MLDGVHFTATIFRKDAYKILKKIEPEVIRDYITKREKLFHEQLGSWERKGKFKNFFVTILKVNSEFKLLVRGSLQVFFQGDNVQNYSGSEIILTIEKICEIFGITPYNMIISKLEIGVNIPMNMPVYEYLSDNLLSHKNTQRVSMDNKKVGKALGFIVPHELYHLKFYEKIKNLMRFEIKISSTKKLRAMGIETGDDICNPIIINALADSLVAEWDEVIMQDGVLLLPPKNQGTPLTKKEAQKLALFSSTIYENSYKNRQRFAEKKEKIALRQFYWRLKKDCLEILRKHGNGGHKNIKKIIVEKVEKFKTSWPENVDKSASIRTGIIDI